MTNIIYMSLSTQFALYIPDLPVRSGLSTKKLDSTPAAVAATAAGAGAAAKRPLLYHQRHDLEQDVRGRNGGELGVGVVRGRHLDDIGRDEIEAFEPAHDGAELARRPAAGFGRAGCGGDYFF